jgi:hypothetical protein
LSWMDPVPFSLLFSVIFFSSPNGMFLCKPVTVKQMRVWVLLGAPLLTRITSSWHFFPFLLSSSQKGVFSPRFLLFWFSETTLSWWWVVRRHHHPRQRSTM